MDLPTGSGSAAATINGAISTTDPGQDASVINTGTSSDVQLEFFILLGQSDLLDLLLIYEIGTVITGLPGSKQWLQSLVIAQNTF